MSVWWCLIDSALVEAICREDETAGTLISVQEAGGRKREQEQVRKAFKLAVYPPVEENVVRLSVAVPMWVLEKKIHLCSQDASGHVLVSYNYDFHLFTLYFGIRRCSSETCVIIPRQRQTISVEFIF